jgi:GNAT superfamily N-acetyltransferase
MKTKPYTFRKAGLEDLPVIAEWLVHISKDPAHHCIHSWSGESSKEIAEGLEKYFNDDELIYLMVFKGETLIGTMGAEYDKAMGCVWLHGPLVDTKHWDKCCEQLYENLVKALPGNMKEFRAYLNTANGSGIAFYQKHGFILKEHPSFVYQLSRMDRVPLPSHIYTPLGKTHQADFKRLFEKLFPDTYYSVERLVEMQGKSHEIFIVQNKHTFAGFVVLDRDENEIQFLGVEPAFRQKGHGKILLSTGINYLFDNENADKVDLNVNGDLENAQKLYESVGFSMQYSGIGLTKTVSSKQ